MAGRPKGTAEPTSIQKAAEAARTALATAKEKLSKQDNATNKAAADHAETRLKDAVKAENRERFENVGGGRVAKIINAIGTLKNVSARRLYEYDATDVTNAFQAIRAELDKTEKAFTSALSTSSSVKRPTTVKFSFKI